MIETEVMSNRFIGDGNNKTFAFGFRFNNVNDIQVWLYDSTTKQLTQRRDFTLSPNSAAMPSDGGTVTFPSEGAAIPSTQMVIIQRHMNLFQLDVYKHGMFLDLDNFERSLDTLVLEMQQINDSVERAIKVSIVPDAQQVDPMIPPLEAGQTIMVSDDGTHFVAVDISELFAQTTSAWKAAETSQKWAEASDSPNEEEDSDSTTGKTRSSKSWSLYAKDWAQSATSPDNKTDEESTTGKTQSAKSWSDYSKDWAQSSTSPDNKDDNKSGTGKTQSSKEWALDAKESQQAALASQNAAKISETNAKTSETNAKTSEMNAKTSETNADISEANAKASEQAAALSETNAAASEQAAATSETNAKKSESAAKTSETNAANSEEMSQKWAESPDSPDGNIDEESPTGKTMSAKEWANSAKAGLINSGGVNVLHRNQAYVVGDYAYSDKIPSWAYLECVTAGTTGGTEPTALPNLGVNDTLVDGTAQFKLYHVALQNNPVGTYRDFGTTFNPNTSWGGTWQQADAGRVLIASGSYSEAGQIYTYNLGQTGGEAAHQLTTNELASHNHGASSNSTGGHEHYSFANTAITNGSNNLNNGNYPAYNRNNSGDDWLEYLIAGTGNGANVGKTSWNGNHSHSITINNNGGNSRHNNIQPYKTVARWYRNG